jgi:starch synthase (maltosyl-transferring)
MAERSRRTQNLPTTYEQIVVDAVSPAVDGGRFPVKAVAGDVVAVEARVFRHGHDRLRCVVLWRSPGATGPREVPMTLVEPGLDRWRAEITLPVVGRYSFVVAGWTDRYGSWVEELRKRVTAAQRDVASEIAEGLAMIERAAGTLERMPRRPAPCWRDCGPCRATRRRCSRWPLRPWPST